MAVAAVLLAAGVVALSIAVSPRRHREPEASTAPGDARATGRSPQLPDAIAEQPPWPPPPSRTDATHFALERRTTAPTVLSPREAAEIALGVVSKTFNFIPAGEGRVYPTNDAERPFHRAVGVIASPAAELDQAEPEFAGDPAHYGERVVWVVRIEGPFHFHAGPGGALFSSNSGFYVIDDATGEVLSWGVP